MGRSRRRRYRLAWHSARARAERMRERWLRAESRCAQLCTAEQVPRTLLVDAEVERDRAHDALERVAKLCAQWGRDGGSISTRQARAELLVALNRPDREDTRVAQLRLRVREMRTGLAQAAQQAELAEAIQHEAEAQHGRAVAVVERMLKAPRVQFEEGGPRYVAEVELREALAATGRRPPPREFVPGGGRGR